MQGPITQDRSRLSLCRPVDYGSVMSSSQFVPRGAASFVVNYDGPPSDFYFLLLPRVTMLAFSSAVEPLRIANQVTGQELYRWYVLSEDGAQVFCSNGIAIAPDSALQDVPKEATAFVCAGTEPMESLSPNAIRWISRQRTFGCRVGGICTGAFALAKADLLKGRKFTLHWENQPAFREHFLDLDPQQTLYEIDDKVVTCGGGTAATDMMLEMIQEDHGVELAAVVADMCIHFRSNAREAPQTSAFSIALGSRNPHLISAVTFMNERLEEPATMDEIANHSGLSRRQLERLFVKYLSKPPMKLYTDLRLARAHAYLNETALPLAEIAAATGFASASQLSVSFKKRYGITPTAHRRSWGENER